MKRLAVMALLMTIICISAALLSAQDDAKPKLTPASFGPPAEIQQIAGLVGTWDVVRKTRWDTTQPPLENKAVCVNTMILDGCALERTVTSQMGHVNYKGRGTVSYNQGLKKWQYTWLDNTGGSLSYYIGSMADGKLVVSGEDITPLVKVWTRITISNITDKQFDEKIESSQDGGVTWRTVATSIYTKK